MSSVAIVNRLSACEYAQLKILAKTVATAATPEQISATDEYFRKATFLGNRGDRTPNTGPVYVGVTGVNDTQQFVLVTTESFELSAPIGCKFSFKDIWLDVSNSGDGVIILYS